MDILHSVAIKTTPERLYEAITSERGLAAWWTPQTKAQPSVGAFNEFGFGPELVISFRVEQLEPGRRVVWSAEDVPPDWQNTRISFEITPGDGSTGFRFCHSGYAAGCANYGLYNYLWGHWVRSLKLLLETGTGEPFGSPGSNAAHPLP